MRVKGRYFMPRLWKIVGVASVVATAAGGTLASVGASGSSARPRIPSPIAHVATGDLTTGAAANVALRYAREAGEAGEVHMVVGRGTLAQVRSVLEGAPVSKATRRL